MPITTPPAEPPSAAQANAAVRAFAAGRTTWTPAALAELARLRQEWVDAVRREQRQAALADETGRVGASKLKCSSEPEPPRVDPPLHGRQQL